MVYRDPSKRYYSEAEAADYLGMTRRMLARRRYDGKIDHVKDGHLISYEQRHLDTYLGRFSTTPPPEPQADVTATEKWYADFKSKGGKKKEKKPNPSRRRYTKAERDQRREAKKRMYHAVMGGLLRGANNDPSREGS